MKELIDLINSGWTIKIENQIKKLNEYNFPVKRVCWEAFKNYEELESRWEGFETAEEAIEDLICTINNLTHEA